MAITLTLEVIPEITDGPRTAIPGNDFGFASREIELYHHGPYRIGAGANITFETGQGLLGGWEAITGYMIATAGVISLLRSSGGNESEVCGPGPILNGVCELTYLQLANGGESPADITIMLWGRRI